MKLFKSHVGRPSNEEKRKRIMVYIAIAVLPIIILAIGVYALYNGSSSKNVLDTDNKNVVIDKGYYIDNGYYNTRLYASIDNDILKLSWKVEFSLHHFYQNDTKVNVHYKVRIRQADKKYYEWESSCGNIGAPSKKNQKLTFSGYKYLADVGKTKKYVIEVRFYRSRRRESTCSSSEGFLTLSDQKIARTLKDYVVINMNYRNKSNARNLQYQVYFDGNANRAAMYKIDAYKSSKAQSSNYKYLKTSGCLQVSDNLKKGLYNKSFKITNVKSGEKIKYIFKLYSGGDCKSSKRMVTSKEKIYVAK